MVNELEITLSITDLRADVGGISLNYFLKKQFINMKSKSKIKSIIPVHSAALCLCSPGGPIILFSVYPLEGLDATAESAA